MIQPKEGKTLYAKLTEETENSIKSGKNGRERGSYLDYFFDCAHFYEKETLSQKPDIWDEMEDSQANKT